MNPRPVAAAALVFLFTAPVVLHPQEAENPEATLPEDENEPETTISEEVVVTATRLETPVDTLGSSVSLIGPEEIEARKKTSALELLRTVPGVHLNQSGGAGTIAGVFLRGGSTAQTLVLVDGVRANSATLGSFDISDVRADNLERIEVVRGPQSTLYGSEAMGGVINIITLKGRDEERRTFEAAAGSESFRNGRLSFSGGTHDVDYSVSVDYEDTDGVSAAGERAGNTEADAYENLSASARLSFGFAGDGRGDWTLRFGDSQTELDGFLFGTGPVDDLNFVKERESLFTTLKLSKPLKSWWSQSVTLALAADGDVATDPDTVFHNSDISTRRLELTTLADFTPSDGDILTLGYHVERRRGVNLGTFDETVYLRSFFAQNQWTWKERLYLTTGLRNDEHSEFGNETTYRATLALLAAGQKTRIHGSYGTGFRAPSLNELFFPNFGNLDLRPESSRGFDLGVEQKLHGGDVTFDVTYFSTSFDDLIGFDFATFRANNVAEAETSGLEVTLRVRTGRVFDLTATYTELDSEDKETGRPLPRRPAQRGTLLLGFRPTEPLSGTVSLITVRDRVESNGIVMDDYDRVDLSFAYRIADRFTPYVRVENLFDEDYEEITGFTSPGITPVVGFSVEF